MEWNLNIPKIFHVYWGGGNFHYMRYLTIKTFRKYNPDWKIVFIYPKYPTNKISWDGNEQKYDIKATDYINEVFNLPIIKLGIDFQTFGLNNNMSEVHKSDFIRLHQLSTIGGVWSDMDIIYFKPMNFLSFNQPENKHIETFYCDHNYGHSVGFLMASRNNKLFGNLKKIAYQKYTPNHYQSIGASIFKKYYSTPELINAITPAINIPMDVVYSYDATYFKEMLEAGEPRFTDESIGLHWYAGSPIWKPFIDSTDGGRTNLPDNIIGNLIKSINLWV